MRFLHSDVSYNSVQNKLLEMSYKVEDGANVMQVCHVLNQRTGNWPIIVRK